MDQWNLEHEAIKATLTFASGALLLSLTWCIGQGLTVFWNIRQKRREFQIVALQQFYSAYGEFFVVWKLWNRIDRKSIHLEEWRWELHKRAAAAEAIVEATMVKLSSEIVLSDPDKVTLGKFRQAFQQLRQAIRKDGDLRWPNAECPEYVAFKVLAVGVCGLLAGNWGTKSPSTSLAAEQLREITSNKWEVKWFELPL